MTAQITPSSTGEQRAELQTIREAPPGRAFYFAFGANLAQRVLQRRQLSPSEATVGSVKGYQLYFKHVGGFATIEEGKGEPPGRPDVCGVVYNLSAAEMVSLRVIEAGYNLVGVDVVSEDGEIIRAQAFMTHWTLRLFEEVPPMVVYMEKIRDGAQENRLPAHYQEWLAQQDAGFDRSKTYNSLNSPAGYFAGAFAGALFAGATYLLIGPPKPKAE